MKLITKLTRMDGRPISVNADRILYVVDSGAGSANLIFAHDHTVSVTETFETVLERIQEVLSG